VRVMLTGGTGDGDAVQPQADTELIDAVIRETARQQGGAVPAPRDGLIRWLRWAPRPA